MSNFNNYINIDTLMMRNSKSVILHAISSHPHLRYSQLANGLFLNSAKLHEKVLAIRLLSPAISASSFKLGRVHDRTDYAESRFGVILGGGQIIAASSQDEYSTALPDGTRLLPEDNNYSFNIEKMQSIIRKRNKHSPYNDLIVQNPKPLGIYFKADPNRREPFSYKSANDLVNVYNILDDMQITPDEVNLAKYVILNGQIRQIHRLRENIKDYLISEQSYDMLYKSNYNNKSLHNPSDINKQKRWQNFTENLTPTQIFERMFVLGISLTPEQISRLSAEADLTLEEKHMLSQRLEHSWSPTYKGFMDQRLGIEINYANTPDYVYNNIEVGDIRRLRQLRPYQSLQGTRSLSEKNEKEQKLRDKKLEEEKQKRLEEDRLREERINRMYPKFVPPGFNMFG